MRQRLSSISRAFSVHVLTVLSSSRKCTSLHSDIADMSELEGEREAATMSEAEHHHITFSLTALSIYAVSCVFFIFLVASLYIVGLTPMRACFR